MSADAMLMSDSTALERQVVRVLWRSTNGGRSWFACDVLARSPLSSGVSHTADGWWDDGFGNLYRNCPPRTTR